MCGYDSPETLSVPYGEDLGLVDDLEVPAWLYEPLPGRGVGSDDEAVPPPVLAATRALRELFRWARRDGLDAHATHAAFVIDAALMFVVGGTDADATGVEDMYEAMAYPELVRLTAVVARCTRTARSGRQLVSTLQREWPGEGFDSLDPGFAQDVLRRIDINDGLPTYAGVDEDIPRRSIAPSGGAARIAAKVGALGIRRSSDPDHIAAVTKKIDCALRRSYKRSSRDDE